MYVSREVSASLHICADSPENLLLADVIPNLVHWPILFVCSVLLTLQPGPTD